MKFPTNLSDQFYQKAIPILLVLIAITTIGILIGAAILVQRDYKEITKQALPFPDLSNLFSKPQVDLTPQEIELSVLVKKAGEYTLPEKYSPPSALPLFVTYDSNLNKLIISPTDRTQVSEYSIVLSPIDPTIAPALTLKLSVELPPVDLTAMEAEIMAVVGAGNPNIGVYVEDLVRGKSFTYNGSHQYKPGSISKLPVGFITLLDLQSGKLQLTSTYPVYNQYKHSYSDAIGMLAAGTKVSIDTYLTQLYRLSNNTAQYHLREMIGNFAQAPGVWSSGVLNERVKAELGVSQWGEDPHIVTALDIAKVWGDIYRGKLYNDQWKNYFYDKLGSAASSLKEGIPAGVPATGVRTVTKVGFLYGGGDNVYSDCGIVFGENTDYMIAVLNNAAPPYPQGKNIIKSISAIVYKYLDI